MQYVKIVVLGITGDLARLKILPAVAQFAELNQTKVVVELVGYSRSNADPIAINNLLNTHTEYSDQHCVSKISLENGEYEDPNFLNSVVASLSGDDRAIVYLAIPPSKFLKILQNSCPYNGTEKIDIIVEKPFGQSELEAQQMINVINACQMGYKIHFCDHYLFKNTTRISSVDKKNFVNYLGKEIKSLRISALEYVGADGRAGYYDQTGAMTDMLPHLYSLLIKTLQLVRPDFNGGQLEFHFSDAKIGQYLGYLSETGLEQSSTETYFKIKSSVAGFQGSDFDLYLESGKHRSSKETKILLEFTDGSVLDWEISPKQSISYVGDNQEISINLDKNKNLDHTNLFEDILNQNHQHFVTNDQVIWGWELHKSMHDYLSKNHLDLIKYSRDQEM